MFLELTPVEFFAAVKSKEEYDGYAVKSVIRHVCETMRLQTHWLVNIQLPKNKKIKNPRQMMRFLWDDEIIKPSQTREEMKSVMKAIASGFKNKKKKKRNG